MRILIKKAFIAISFLVILSLLEIGYNEIISYYIKTVGENYATLITLAFTAIGFVTLVTMCYLIYRVITGPQV